MIMASSTCGVRIDICGFPCLIRRYASSFIRWLYADVADSAINIVAVIVATDGLRAEVHIEILALEIKYIFWAFTRNRAFTRNYTGCVASDLIGLSLLLLTESYRDCGIGNW